MERIGDIDMGLKKHITLPNGVQLNYHRVVSLNIITNNQNVIEVASYTSQTKRREESACMEALANGDNEASCDVFIETKTYTAPYDQGMTVESAYAYLKSLSEFDGAEDVMETD